MTHFMIGVLCGVSSGCVLTAIALSAAQPQGVQVAPPPDKLQARLIEIVDPDGNVVIKLAAGFGGGHISLFSDLGRPSI